MCITIEADLENGHLKGPKVAQLPKSAQVQVTVIGPAVRQRPEFGTLTSVPIIMAENAFAPLSKQELLEWGM